MSDSAQPIQLRRPTTPATIGGHDRKNRVLHRAVSASTGPTGPSPDTTLHDHAAALARQHPGVPLPNEGMPYPNSDEYAVSDESSARIEALTTQLIDDFFGTPMETREIAWLSRKAIEYGVRIHRTPAISAAIGRADPAQVRAVGRHLVRTSTAESPTVLGMAMLAEVGTGEDVSLIQTLGLLSNTFGPLAADALARLPNPHLAGRPFRRLGPRVSRRSHLSAGRSRRRAVATPQALRQQPSERLLRLQSRLRHAAAQ
ncbi:hypothetical protein AB0I30_29640 [Nocardia tengchongensis]|uniref:hypothetical protein n=1 Tax=Nocardia tengchongensis TaxID=2055889 RepID=UPI003405D2EA